MKKLLTLLAVGLMILSLAACGKKEEPAEEQVAGGWTKVEDGTMTPELQEIFDKAIEGLVGVNYEAVELVETQVVAGTNYKFLAKGTTVTMPPMEGTYYVTVYKNLDGGVELLNIEQIEQTLVGGWEMPEDKTVTPELKDMFDTAMEGLLGVTYEPLELVATQLVAGTNYMFYCNGTTVTNPPETKPYYVSIYQPLEGAPEILAIDPAE